MAVSKHPWLWLITLIGVIVPRRLRANWRQEWEAELQYRERLLAQWRQLNWRTKLDLFSHSAGAFMDALWLQPRRWEDAMIQDLRFGVRMLLKHKGFTTVAILSLALGIGANTAIFQLIDAVRLRTLPVRAPEELVELRMAKMDKVGAPFVAIVNQALARRFTNGANPVGQRLWIAAAPGSPDTVYEIVGFVGDTKYQDLREEYHPIVYYAAAQDEGAGAGGMFLLRSRLPQSETVAAVKRVLNEINPAITVNFEGLKPMIDATVLRERLIATLSGFFGLLALLLACIGVYGILSYGVASRTTELGIRMALGAQRADVFWLILREALLLAITGVVVGLPLIFAVTRLAATLLYDLSPTDPISISAAALLMLVVALLAGYLPSRRATRVDPMVALRCE